MSGEEAKIREELCRIGRKLYERHLTSGAGGSISARTTENEVLIKPSGFSLADMMPEHVVKLNLKGEVLEGKYPPSSDAPWHLMIYERRPEVNAIVHAHPPICGGFACAGISLDIPTFTEVIIQIGHIPLMDYATPTTMDYAKVVADSLKEANALLMKNHGAITLGVNLEQAFQRMELLEDFARMVLIAKILGGPILLPPEETCKLRSLESEKWRMKIVEELYK
ncbi:MAG: class II aldolase/adducin family protein [Candidatus Bathyarchaeia archaeon]|nr:class II aldolase/adducin family protein [Candidatus Bathyarchaeota archaeon]